MDRSQAANRKHVIFGRPNGEQTLGEIVKVNQVNAKVKLLEPRGTGRGSEIGSVWKVPYDMLRPATAEEIQARSKTIGARIERTLPSKGADVPIEYSDFQPREDQHILDAINCVYSDLSPENLTCDGELPLAEVRQRRQELERKLKGLFLALGREVSEEVADQWARQRNKAEANPEAQTL